MYAKVSSQIISFLNILILLKILVIIKKIKIGLIIFLITLLFIDISNILMSSQLYFNFPRKIILQKKYHLVIIIDIIYSKYS